MSILQITNLTDKPYDMLRDKINDAIERAKEETGKELSVDEERKIHDYFDGIIEDFEENGSVKDALGFVDNLLVNHDYYATVKDLINN